MWLQHLWLSRVSLSFWAGSQFTFTLLQHVTFETWTREKYFVLVSHCSVTTSVKGGPLDPEWGECEAIKRGAWCQQRNLKYWTFPQLRKHQGYCNLARFELSERMSQRLPLFWHNDFLLMHSNQFNNISQRHKSLIFHRQIGFILDFLFSCALKMLTTLCMHAEGSFFPDPMASHLWLVLLF